MATQCLARNHLEEFYFQNELNIKYAKLYADKSTVIWPGNEMFVPTSIYAKISSDEQIITAYSRWDGYGYEQLFEGENLLYTGPSVSHLHIYVKNDSNDNLLIDKNEFIGWMRINTI